MSLVRSRGFDYAFGYTSGYITGVTGGTGVTSDREISPQAYPHTPTALKMKIEDEVSFTLFAYGYIKFEICIHAI